MSAVVRSLFIFSILCSTFTVIAQEAVYTRQDSLRGSITPEREWWDLLHYDLYVSVDMENHTISGSNLIKYKVLSTYQSMQIDLQTPMQIGQVTQNGNALDVRHDGNAHFIRFEEEQKVGETYEIEVRFSGKPLEATNPPWDAGFTWTKDSNGKDWVVSTSQGIGASVWWPNKDHYYDEPDEGIQLSVNVPKGLIAVGNGRLIKEVKEKNKTQTFIWGVKSPINNYGVNLNIGDYVNFNDVYQGKNGPLDLGFWVLTENLKKAKVHFKEVDRTLEAFEYWLGPYPFYEDSYKLIDVPYLGMEHQSAVTYGNQYSMGYLNRDLSLTGWGLKWDYIIVHETAHEWWGNSITHRDAADLWIHESFAFYSESLFIEYFYGKEAASDYLKGARYSIHNQGTIVGDYGVHNEGVDIYNKGGNMLHTLRQIIDDDSLWHDILIGLNKEFYHQIVDSKDIEEYLANRSGLDLDAFFNQYLRDSRIPILEYAKYQGDLIFRWTNCIPDFNMPVKIYLDGQAEIIYPQTGWGRYKLGDPIEDLEVDKEYYVYSNELFINEINE
ncbi:MAG: M1 family metallopeptidase [Bacteroidota bacterium]